MPPIDEDHTRPEAASDGLVAAAGAMSEAFERIERARGALYTFHQLIGGAMPSSTMSLTAYAPTGSTVWLIAFATS